MALMFFEERKTFHHPGIQTGAGMLGYLSHDVKALLQPAQFRARRGRKDRRFAILTLVPVARYIFAVVSEARFNVV